MKSYMKNVVVALMALLITRVVIAVQPYIILEDERKRDIKRKVEVILPERVTKQELKEIAEAIHQPGFERTFIGYRLTEDYVVNPSIGYWATTNFVPNLDITIFGSTKEENQALNSIHIQGKNGEIIGVWRLNYGSLEHKFVFRKAGDSMIAERIYSAGTKSQEKLTSETFGTQTRYYLECCKERGEYYVINDKGDLMDKSHDIIPSEEHYMEIQRNAFDAFTRLTQKLEATIKH